MGWPLDHVIHAEVWATDTIHADLPPMVEFKAKADTIIKERWGIEVEHITSGTTYDQLFHRTVTKQRRGNEDWTGKIRGFPFIKGPWCNRDLKVIEQLAGIVKMQADIIQRQSEALEQVRAVATLEEMIEQAAEAWRNVTGEL